MKNDSKISNREYRILAVAIIFFAIGLFFFTKNESGTGKSDDYAKPSDLQVIQNSFADPSFAKYPEPSELQTIDYRNGKINNGENFQITGDCHDAYLTILIFPAEVDYRSDLTKAIFNKALPCQAGQKFTYDITKDSFLNYPEGNYYVIMADQGKDGTWYNPI